MPSNDLNQFRTEAQEHAFFQVDMDKTRKKKAKKGAESTSQKAIDDPKPKFQPEVPEEDKTFDFGGLPNRDLKKNLGCG